jgi:hypothetical protein
MADSRFYWFNGIRLIRKSGFVCGVKISRPIKLVFESDFVKFDDC